MSKKEPEQYAPWSTDPDPPLRRMTPEQAREAGRKALELMELKGLLQPRQEPEKPVVEDVVLHMMKRDGIPVTRQNYLDMAYPGGVPKPWTAELEAELPLAVRR